jgi:hypothetical protein
MCVSLQLQIIKPSIHIPVSMPYHVAEVTDGLKLQEGLITQYNDKKEKRAVAKSYIRNGFLIYEEMRKYFPIYEEAVSHI